MKKSDDKKSTKSKKSDKSLASHKKSTSSKKSAAGTPHKKSPAGTPKRSPSGTPKRSPVGSPKHGATPKKAPTPPDERLPKESLALPDPAAIQMTTSESQLGPVDARLITRPLLPSQPVAQQPPPPMQEPVPNVCSIHGQPFALFCESCEEPICYECQYAGMHSADLHKIVDAKEAAATRMQYLTSKIYEAVMKKRDAVLAQADKVDYRLGEIKSVCGIIEKDIKTEYSGMLDRLGSVEGTKLAILQHDMASLQKDIERIDSALNSVDEFSQGDSKCDYAAFLAKFKEMREYMEYAITKPFKSEIAVTPQDLPGEQMVRQNTFEKAKQVDNLLRLKDKIILDLLRENKKAQTSEAELETAVQQDWGEWQGLIDRFTQCLTTYSLVCSFCGVPLTESAINSKCLRNREPHRDLSKERYTAEEPAPETVGNERHYFGKPLCKGRNSLLARLMVDSGASAAYLAIKEGGRVPLVDSYRRLQVADPESRGHVARAQFVEAFKGKYDVEDDAFDRLGLALSPDADQTGRVHYKEFFSHVDSLMALPPPPPAPGTQSMPGAAKTTMGFFSHETLSASPQPQSRYQYQAYQPQQQTTPSGMGGYPTARPTAAGVFGPSSGLGPMAQSMPANPLYATYSGSFGATGDSKKYFKDLGKSESATSE